MSPGAGRGILILAEPVRLGTHPHSHPLLEPSGSLGLFCPGKQRVRTVQGASSRQSWGPSHQESTPPPQGEDGVSVFLHVATPVSSVGFCTH